MTTLVTLRLPVPWQSLGLPAPARLGSTTLLDGDDPGWAWDGDAPAFPIDECERIRGEPITGWLLDHVVLLVPDLDEAVALLGRSTIEPRLRMAVRGRPAAFFRVGPVLEVIESPVRAPSLYGAALATEEPLEVVTLRWRGLGFDIGDPRPAIQPGRRIMTVRGLGAGLAVMSPDGAVRSRR